MIVVGVDPSLSGMAVCKSDDAGLVTEHEFVSKKSGDTVFYRLQRHRRLVAQVCGSIWEPPPPSSVVVYVEGYSFGSKGGQAFDRAELRGLLYDRIAIAAAIVEVAPATLKLFATGVGKGDKAAVASALAARYHRSFASENRADAFGLMMLGLCVERVREPETAAQRKAVETVRKLREAA